MNLRCPLAQRPRAYIDVETTGYDAHVHEIIEIAVVFDADVAQSRDIPHLTYDDDYAFFTTRVKPERIHFADPEALRVNGYAEHPELWARAPTFPKIVDVVCELLRDAICVGHNVSFDVDFIQQALLSAGTTFQPDHHKIDTVTLAYAQLVPLGLQRLSLDPIRTFLGWPVEGGHRALRDALDARRLYHHLTQERVRVV